METIKGGNPDRFVNQYEFMDIIMEVPIDPFCQPGKEMKTSWGVTFRWPEGQLGQFPVHDEEHKVLKDITEWKKYVKVPVIKTADEDWAAAVAHAKAIDRKEQFITVFYNPGIFEMTHHLMGIDDALIAYSEEPEAMHELIDCLTEFELAFAKEIVSRVRPEAIFHHDDWGTQRSSFMSPAMFDEFILPAYEQIYGYYKDHGVELIVHHCDSYAANLVPSMIKMGVDIWQGVMTTNNTPELIKKYGKQISFMGDIDSGVVDFPGWNKELIAREVERACRNCGKLYFIPCLTQGLNLSSFPGVYEAASEAIDKINKEGLR